MNINIDAFLSTLPVAAKCMAGIFLVTAVIILSMYLLGRFTKDKKDK